MARDVYSLRIFGHASLASSAGIVGPLVPAGLVYVLRDVDVFENSGVTPADMEIINALGGALVYFDRTATTQPLGYQWTGRQVYEPGEQVGFRVFHGSWAIQASGYQLTLP